MITPAAISADGQPFVHGHRVEPKLSGWCATLNPITRPEIHMPKRTDMTKQTAKNPQLNPTSLNAIVPMASNLRSRAFCFTAFFSALLFLTGCQSSKAPGSSSTAAVVISGGNPRAIRDATLKVFEENDYTMLRSDETELVFEREGTKWDTAMYGTWGGGKLWMKVEVKIQPQEAGQLLRCDVFAVRNHGDAFFSETLKIRPINAGPYKKMLEEVKSRVGKGGAVVPSS